MFALFKGHFSNKVKFLSPEELAVRLQSKR